MGKKLSSKEETAVLVAIAELKSATLSEVQEKIKEKWQMDIDSTKLVRYLNRWRKGKYVSSNLLGKDWVYSLRDIPWLPKAQMIHVLKPDVSDTEAKEFLENYKEEVKKRGYFTARVPDIRDYKTFECTFEIVDRVAGGSISPTDDNDDEGENRVLLLPRESGEVYIPRSWLVGWIRDNARLINMTQSIKWNIGVSPAKFVKPPKIEKRRVIGKKGPQTHETIGKGEQYKFLLSYPTHGTRIKTKEDLRNYFAKIERTPIKGMGSFDKAFGGNVKLIELKELD